METLNEAEQPILDYIHQAQTHGLTDFEIKQNLLNAGWEAEIVERSFVLARAADNRPAVIAAAKPTPEAQNLKFTDLPKAGQPLSQAGPSALITDGQNFQKSGQASQPPLYKNKFFWPVLILLFILAGSAFGYFVYAYQTPSKIWSKYLTAKKPPVYKAAYSFSYNFTDASSTKPIAITLTGQSYNNFSDQNNAQSGNSLSLGMKSDQAAISGSFKYLALGNIFYLDISQIPQLKTLSGITADWIKLDMAALQTYLQASSPQAAQQFSDYQKNNAQIKAALQKIWSDPKILQFDPSVAKETVKAGPAYRLNISVNSQAAASATVASLNLIQSFTNPSAPKVTAEQEKLFSQLIAKFKIKEGSVWIGQKDSQLYQIHLVIAVPSAADLAGSQISGSMPGIGQAQSKSRDGQRLADIRQISQSLQLFYNDHQGYPETAAGIPQGLVPSYLATYPQPPQPPGGSCTDYFGRYYYYLAQGQPKIIKGLKVYPSFTVTTCLGNDTGGFKAGVMELTPTGLSGNIACPTTPEKCANPPTPAQTQDLSAQIDKLAFNDSLAVDISYSDFGTMENLQAPAGAADVLDLIKNLMGSFTQGSSASGTPPAGQ